MEKPKLRFSILRFIWGVIPWLIVAAIVAFIVSMGGQLKEKKAALAKAKKEAIKKETAAIRVITLNLKPERLEDKINLPANVVPYENLWLKAEVPGQVVKVMVEEGQFIKKGQVLVHLDDRDYLSRLAQIEANHRMAKLDYDRMAELARKKIAAATRLDEAEARLKDLAARLDEVKLALSRTRIRTPISGRLNELKAKLGDLINAGQNVAQILQFEKVKVIVGVPESDVAAVFDLHEAEIVIEALNGKRVKGRKVFLSRQPRTLARLYDLELLVPNPDGRILPGMFARVELIKEIFQEALTVPLYAVITQNKERFVYVEENGRAVKRSVELGILSGWQVQIKAGLKPGDRVIIVGHRLLDNGQTVEVIKTVNNPSEIIES
ncbi:efflux RND transporter periplasmic adaptor subunit [Thermodesulfobacteriota bacterium]